jgi:plastocyanin
MTRTRFAHAALVVTLATGGGPAGAAPAAATTIVIENMTYAPATQTVARGKGVTWINRDLVPHTVSAAGFDSGAIAPGASWTYVPAKAGSVDYRCAYHPTMKATLVVQ